MTGGPASLGLRTPPPPPPISSPPRATETWSREQLSAIRAMAASSPMALAMYVDKRYLPAPHLTLINRSLCEMLHGNLRRLMVFTPPRHGKSELLSVYTPACWLGNRPDDRVITASYSGDLAQEFAARSREIFREHAPTLWNVEPAGRATGAMGGVHRWHVARPNKGGLYAVGVGGQTTGRGANLLNIDDPVKNDADANSARMRDNTWNWYLSTARTRLEPDGRIILVMTRWHEDDLAGRILNAPGGGNWRIITLPALAEPTADEPDPLGRSQGVALWPDRYDEQALAALKEEASAYFWSAMYQQRPTPRGGGMFVTDKFQLIDACPACRYDGSHHPHSRDKIQALAAPEREAALTCPMRDARWVRFWDLAVTTRDYGSYTASLMVGTNREGKVFLRDGWRARIEWPEQKREIIARAQMEPEAQVVIEKALHGMAAVQELRADPKMLERSVIGYQVETDKVTRALPAQNRLDAGQVYLVRGEWNADFLDECAHFPHGANDDQVDCFSGGMQEAVRQLNW